MDDAEVEAAIAAAVRVYAASIPAKAVPPTPETTPEPKTYQPSTAANRRPPSRRGSTQTGAA